MESSTMTGLSSSALVVVAIQLLVLCVVSVRIEGFTIGQKVVVWESEPTVSQKGNNWALYATPDEEEEEDDEDDDDEIDDASLGDWRKFRASLIDAGLPSETESSTTKQQQPKKKQKKSVAVQNEALLAQQNEKLAEEYRAGVWAHPIGQPEVGGLLCRMPLEAELYHGSGYWKDKLQLMLSLDDDNKKGASSSSGKETQTNSNDDEEADHLTLSRVDHWFKVAERMLTRELQTMTSGRKQINPEKDLGTNERELINKYLAYRQTWQEICLVLSHNPETGHSESVILNRPITKNINKPLATMLLEGQSGSGKGSFSYDFVDMVVQAFGAEAAVYMGGPDLQTEPALLVHGIPNLPGAREIAPGTGIYRGGWEAAVDGVLKGEYKPLDFRFFLGRQLYDPQENPQRGALLQKIQDGIYQPLACARSLALKQCLGLPKPLWHEVLELCGGELKALSSIELRKRIDLQQ